MQSHKYKISHSLYAYIAMQSVNRTENTYSETIIIIIIIIIQGIPSLKRKIITNNSDSLSDEQLNITTLDRSIDRLDRQTSTRFVEHQERRVDRFHARRTRERTHHPVVDTLAVICVQTRKIADAVSDGELDHANHTPEASTTKNSTSCTAIGIGEYIYIGHNVGAE